MKRNTTFRTAATLGAVLSVAPGAALADGPAQPNTFWWPDQLDVSPLRRNAAESNPLGPDFNYAKEFATLDLAALKAFQADYPEAECCLVSFAPEPLVVDGIRCEPLEPWLRRLKV